MKIDVITRHSVPNYGSLLQTYATIKLFENLNCDCDIINYIRYDERANKLGKTLLLSNSKWNKNFIARSIFKLIQVPSYKHMVNKFKIYQNKLIGSHLTKEYGTLEELRKNIPSADMYCSGSDQIWGKIGSDSYDPAYFLNFLDESKKCFSLASSFGKDIIDSTLEKKLPMYLKKYNFITVREKSAVEILKNNRIDAKLFLDPTMLIDKDIWNGLKDNSGFKEKYILVYQLHSSKEFNLYLKKLKEQTGLKIYRICPSFHHIFKFGKAIYLPTIEQFLGYISNASYVITDSFHCTVFSILFNKKFCSYLANNTNTRIVNLIETFDLSPAILKKIDNFDWLITKYDWEKINLKLENIKKDNLGYLKEKLFPEKNVEKVGNKCCGCRCCEQVCPKKAIYFKEDEEGFEKPLINYEKCINCGVCLNRCPQFSDTTNNSFVQKVYAAKISNINEQKTSSSGGIFSALANYVIKKQGYVCGAVYEGRKVKHYITNDKNELNKFKGSKYVQSDTMDTYSKIKELLENERLVLYSGTPCQIAGLKMYLRKEYENLITVDLICHGVPSQKLLRNYFKYLDNKYKGEVIEYNFRSKEKDIWGTNSKVIYKKDGKIKTDYIRSSLDPYYKSFLEGKTYRKCCYTCKYASAQRIGDITLGDYWGVEEFHPEFKDYNGVSLVLVNTKTGKNVFEKIEDEIVYVESSIEYAKKYNHNLNAPVNMSDDRYNAYENLGSLDFNTYAKKSLKFKKELKEIIKSIIPQSIKNIIKEIINK